MILVFFVEFCLFTCLCWNTKLMKANRFNLEQESCLSIFRLSIFADDNNNYLKNYCQHSKLLIGIGQCLRSLCHTDCCFVVCWLITDRWTKCSVIQTPNIKFYFWLYHLKDKKRRRRIYSILFAHKKNANRYSQSPVADVVQIKLLSRTCFFQSRKT